MKFNEIPKNIPERKYIVYQSGERWGENILGIYTIKIDGDITISNDDASIEVYIPLEMLPLKDKELNSLGVNHLLIVTKRYSTSISYSEYKNSERYISYVRDNNIDEIVNDEEKEEEINI